MRDPGRAVPEVADLIGRVRRRDPDQARELLDRTAARVSPANRAFVRELWNGGVGDADRDGEGHDDRSPAIRDKLYRPDAGTPGVRPLVYREGYEYVDGRWVPVPPDRRARVPLSDATGQGTGADPNGDPAATPQPSSAPPPGAVSQDEHGSWYDDNGDPVEAPGNPLLHRAQVPVPAPAMGAGAGAGAGATGQNSPKVL